MAGEFISGWTFQRGDGGSPEVFTNIGKVEEASGFGVTNELVEVTNFDSNGRREFISGLSDGQEITLTCIDLLADSQQAGIISDVNAKLNRNMRFIESDGVNTIQYDFNAVMLGWEKNPANQDKNTVNFTLKISGDIVQS